jgi:hypothetical protein
MSGYEYYNDYLNNLERFQPSEYRLLFKPTTLPINLAEAKEHLKVEDDNSDTYISLLIANVVNFAEKYTKRDFITKKYRTYIDCFFEPIIIRRSKLVDIDSIKYLKDGSLETVDSSIYYFTDDTDFAQIRVEDSKDFPSDFDTRKQVINIDFFAGYGVKVQSAILASNVVTVTTVDNHYFSTGQSIVMAGALPDNFNGTFQITVTGDKTFTYPLTLGDQTATGTIFANDIPHDLKVAMLQHISKVFSNRGDCEKNGGAACDCGSAMNLPAEAKQTYDMYRIWEIS